MRHFVIFPANGISFAPFKEKYFNMEKGTISVQTENIFPIIKKYLYSDHEIFLRELVSNAVDATQKIKTLSSKGEAKGELGDLAIEVILNKDAKTLTIKDKGLGMTGEEVKKYINQIAFSSASEFLEKHKDDANIIGHFGLGFYSAFMVADKVEIRTKSYKEDTTGVTWTCDGTTSFTLEENDKQKRGTEVILFINEENKEFLEPARIKTLLNKYCKFLPVPIQFEGEIINNTSPAWTKNPTDLTPQDYQDFYKELYPYSEAPLFWIHLNVDYPFKLTGILYFPKLKNSYEVQKNKIQLYSNQVFVTDSVQEIVPEWLTLLHGVLDSPDIPLNVSRSYLQSDINVKKINSHISKKVADKLEELIKEDRKKFDENWDHVGVFVKYGMMSDDKFSERAKKFCLLRNTEEEFFTVEEYKEKIKEHQTDKNNKLVGLYTTNIEEQDIFVNAAKLKGYDVLAMDTIIDGHFISYLEQNEENISFKRVDADTTDNLIEKDEETTSLLSENEEKQLKELVTESIDNKTMEIVLKGMSSDDQPAMITKPEVTRRMKEMSEMGGMSFGAMPEFFNLVINTNHPVTSKILSTESKEDKQKMIRQLYDMALLSQNMLKGKELTDFLKRSVELLNK